MTELRFYHLQRTSLERALPSLLERAIGRGHRIIVMTSSQERLTYLDGHLWTYSRESFLPHGTAADGQAQHQPIWLTLEDENPNNADVLILTDGAWSERVADFALCCLIFDGGDDEALGTARQRWKTCKAAGHTVTYWQQDERGQWHQNA